MIPLLPLQVDGSQYSCWGAKRRMGVVRIQYEALTVDQILFIGENAEEEWSNSNSEKEKKELDSTIAFATISFCVFLQG